MIKKLWLIMIVFSFPAIAKVDLELNFSAETNGPGIKIEGNVKKYQLSYDPKSPSLTSLEIDALDLTTGMEMRDEHLHKKVFDATQRAQALISFKTKSFECSKNHEECNLKGVLKIKSVTQDLDIIVKKENQGKILSGKTSISLTSFQLKAPSFMGIRPNDQIEVSFKIKDE